MRRSIRQTLVAGLVFLFLAPSGSRAEDEALVAPSPAVSTPTPASIPATDGPSARSVPKRKARGGAHDKEAEGTQAPDRFEADTVIKSKYHLNGTPLEVDPD